MIDKHPHVSAVSSRQRLVNNRKIGGADVTELRELTIIDTYLQKPFKNLSDVIADIRKPILAAVNGKAVSLFHPNDE